MILKFKSGSLTSDAARFLEDVRKQFDLNKAGKSISLSVNDERLLTIEVLEHDGLCDPIHMPKGRFVIPARISQAVNSGELSGIDAINAIGANYAAFAPRRGRGQAPPAGDKIKQTSVWLQGNQIAWLAARGDISEQLRALVDQAMQQE